MKHWILLFTVGMFIGEILAAMAQVQPPRRRHRMLVNPDAKQEKTFTVDIGKNLKDIDRKSVV